MSIELKKIKANIVAQSKPPPGVTVSKILVGNLGIVNVYFEEVLSEGISIRANVMYGEVGQKFDVIELTFTPTGDTNVITFDLLTHGVIKFSYVMDARWGSHTTLPC